MAVYSKRLLSGSTNGRPIKVTGTNSAGAVTVHTAIAGTSGFDEVYLYAVNTSAAAVLLSVEFGGTSDPDDHIQITVPAEAGLYSIAPGLPINNGLVVKAFAASANVINLLGFVNRIE